MGIPLPWHKRHALLLASQLPENTDDAHMVIQALTELLDTFLTRDGEDMPQLADNVLPFATG